MKTQNVRDVKTKALVLRRTNYGETDRILTLITPEGKKSVLAKGVRKERSKLAGAVEVFSVSEVVLHKGRGELLTLIGAKMEKFFANIMTDFSKLEAASEVLKLVNRAAEGADNVEYYEIAQQSLEAINDGVAIELVMAWFYFNLAKAGGEQVNLFVDVDGGRLVAGEHYIWNAVEMTLCPEPKGKIGTDEIKVMRLMLSAKLQLVNRVQGVDEMLPEILYVAKTLAS